VSQPPDVRKGQAYHELTRDEFIRRFLERFYDPAFDATGTEIGRVASVAWDNLQKYRKDPRTRKAGPGFADPEFPLSIQWLETRDRIREAQQAHEAPDAQARVLVVCGAARHDKTCSGEMSKTFRLAELARGEIEAAGAICDLLDLSALTTEYGRQILPCKACVSTAMPLCHWPCSCYPNHAMGQTQDWMNEIYPRWVAAHGVLIVTPVYWYQAPSVLKLMIDRLVCADGGNPDPTTTHGKDPEKAKALELSGWSYPRHLEGRVFGVFVHGDTAGSEALRHALTGWLTDMSLVEATSASVDRYIGYYEPYATSHDALDRDTAVQDDVRNVARSVVDAIAGMRSGTFARTDGRSRDPRPK
jgi:multimeric flavodoxin WrbA